MENSRGEIAKDILLKTAVNDIEIEFEQHEESNDWKDFYEVSDSVE